MKSNLIKIGNLLLFCLLASGARAFVVFQDNFNYPAGALTNSTWVAGVGNTLNSTISANGSGAITIGYGATTSDQPRAYFTNGYAFIPSAPNFPNPTYYFPSNSPAVALYAGFTINLSGSASAGTYIAYFTDTNFDYNARIYTTNAPGGGYQLAIQNAGTYISTNLNGHNLLNPVVLSAGQNYQVVVRYVNASGLATLWVNPTAETFTGNSNSTDSTSVTCTGPTAIGGGASGTSPAGFGLRNASGVGEITISQLVVGTAFADVLPTSYGSNPPFIPVQPQDNPYGFAGNSVTFSVGAVGDAPLSYQWYYNTNTLLVDSASVYGAANSVLVLSNLTADAAGTYDCVATNAAGTNITRFALLTVYDSPIAPAITNEPANSTNTAGDTATFSVLAGGIPLPTCQWYSITNTGSALKTNTLSGATLTNLTLVNVTTNLSGNEYFVVVKNLAGSVTSAPAILIVNPIPLVNVGYLRSLIDPTTFTPTNTTSLYTIQGYVTTWTNMTSSGNTEFYMQDATAGICVFWSGAPASTNRPPAGAYVQVTGAMASFDGLLELEPYFTNSLTGVKIISTNNPLPPAQPLPFDPNVTGDHSLMEQLEGTYFVASNVTLTAGASISSGANEFITNNFYHVLTNDVGANVSFTNAAGQTFTIYWNAYTGIPGKAKPAGPVTVYGVLGNFNGTYELTPSRYADIISYIHVTNILADARPGDLPTNTYTESVLRPGETMTTTFSLGDPEGGLLTLTPVTIGLPASAYWTNITSGATATAELVYTPAQADAGVQYTIQVSADSSSGNSFSPAATIYVPTLQEQQLAITEFLANPTTNPAAPYYNPLRRATVTGASTNDQYIEIVNQSPNDLSSEFTLDTGNINALVYDSFAHGDTLGTSNSLVVYGGAGSALPGVSPVQASGAGLYLPTTGNNVLVLRDGNGYIIDRVAYSAANLSTNGSLSRFPTYTSAFVPQTYVSTNLTTPDAQYDGGPWSSLAKVPVAVTNISITYANGKAVLQFPANTLQASTLWNADSVVGPYNVIYGQPFPSGSGVFTNISSASQQFYFITTQ